MFLQEMPEHTVTDAGKHVPSNPDQYHPSPLRAQAQHSDDTSAPDEKRACRGSDMQLPVTDLIKPRTPYMSKPSIVAFAHLKARLFVRAQTAQST
jgi:hypothetical protein